MFYQKTLKRSISCSGIGLHTGKQAGITIRPAVSSTGIVFKRVDLPGSPSIKAVCDFVSDTRLATTLKRGDVAVMTVEHLMAAFAIMRVDNAVVEIDGPELPIMDGSALSFVEMLRNAGTAEQESLRRYIIVKRPVAVENNDSKASISPSLESRVTCSVDYDHSALEPQTFSCSILNIGLEKEVSEARTFGFLKEVEMLKAGGFALGGSLENAIVIDETGILNEEGLRYPDELVRHKVLDSLGDLYLMGAPVIGHFVSYKGGHALTHKLVTRLLSDADSWEYIAFKDGAPSHPSGKAEEE